MMLNEDCHPYRPPMPGYVYVMRNGKGHYKIGHSVNPRKRRSQLSRVENPVRIILLIATPDMVALEISLQQRYAAKHVMGEWYRLNRADLNALIKHQGAVRYDPLTFDWKALGAK